MKIKKKVILHLLTSLGPGGAQSTLGSLVSDPDSSASPIVVALEGGGIYVDIIRSYGVEVHTLGFSKWRPNVIPLLRFLRIIFVNKPDVIQAWMYHAELLSLVAKIILKVPVYWNIRSGIHAGLGSILVRACAFLSSLPDAVVVNSFHGKLVHQQLGYSPKRWVVIHNGIDIHRFRPCVESRLSVRREFGLSDSCFIVGLVARIAPQKGHDLLFRASKVLIEKFPNLFFFIVGAGDPESEREARELVSDIAPLGRILFLGQRTDVARLTTSFDVACMISEGEGFPNVLAEAMATGVPCVVTNVGDAALLLDNEYLTINSGDLVALISKIEWLISLPETERQSIGARGRDRIVRSFGVLSMRQKYNSLYSVYFGDK